MSFGTETVGVQFASLSGVAVVDGVEGFGGSGPPPGAGATLASVNGVRTQGLSFPSAMALAKQRKRPLRLGFVEASPEKLMDSLLSDDAGRGATTAASTRRAVEAALESDEAAELAEQVNSFVASFNDADLRECHKRGGAEAPATMFWSAVDFAASFLRDRGLVRFEPPARGRRAASPSGEDEDAFWDAVRGDVERAIMTRVFDAAARLSPELGKGDGELSAHLSRLRFLRLEHLGVVTPAPGGGKTDGVRLTPPSPESGAEWHVAQLELQAASECRSVSDVLEKVSSAVRFIASAVEACSNRGRPLASYDAIGADELLPATGSETGAERLKHLRREA